MLGVFLALDLFLFYVFWEVVLVPMYFLIGIWGGRRPRLRRRQVRPLHAGRARCSCWSAILALVLPARGGHRRVHASTCSCSRSCGGPGRGAARALALPRLRPRLRHQGADVPVPHLAARRPHRGAHRGLGDPGRACCSSWAPTASCASACPSSPRPPLAFAPCDRRARRHRHHLRGDRRHWCSPTSRSWSPTRRSATSASSCSGIFAFNEQGMQGGDPPDDQPRPLTGALFLLVGMIYERRHTPAIADFGGLRRSCPVFAALRAHRALSSIGLPGLNGFVGEFLILVGTFAGEPALAVVAAIGVILAALYLLWVYQRVFLGEVDGRGERRARRLSSREGRSWCPLLAVIVLSGVYPEPSWTRIEPAVSELVAHLEQLSVQSRGGGHRWPRRESRSDASAMTIDPARSTSALIVPGRGDSASPGRPLLLDLLPPRAPAGAPRACDRARPLRGGHRPAASRSSASGSSDVTGLPRAGRCRRQLRALRDRRHLRSVTGLALLESIDYLQAPRGADGPASSTSSCSCRRPAW